MSIVSRTKNDGQPREAEKELVVDNICKTEPRENAVGRGGLVATVPTELTEANWPAKSSLWQADAAGLLPKFKI